MKVEYASWLKATYGFSESMRELVPDPEASRPLLKLEPGAPDSRTASPRRQLDGQDEDRQATASSSSPPCAHASERRSSTVRASQSASSVQRTPSGSAARCFPCPSGRLVEHREQPSGSRCSSSTSSSEARARPVGSLALVAPVAVLHLSDDHAGDALELPGGGELREERRRRSTAALCTSSKNRIAPSDSNSHGVPIVCMRSQRQPPTSGAVTFPPCSARTYGSSGSPRDLARAAACQHLDEPIAGEGRPILVADSDEAVAVQRGEPCRLPDCDVQRGDVGIPDERLRVRADDVEVEVRNRLGRAEATLQALHDIDLGVSEESGEVGRAATRIAGDVVVTVEDAVGKLDPVALRLPPLDAAEDLRAPVVRARRRSDSDRATGRQRAAKAWLDS